MSSIKVVVAAPKREPVKFSKVSFLGPILERGAIDLMVQPTERALLERRYLDRVARRTVYAVLPRETFAIKDEWSDSIHLSGDGKLVDLIDEALSATKAEPVYGAE